jgi:hypothetical protein
VRSLTWLAALAVTAASGACSSGGGKPDQQERPAPQVPDAAVTIVEPPLDPYADYPAGAGTKMREPRIIQIMLASSPSGALAKVDGKVAGRTPTYWEGEFTGRERVFTFEMPGHTTATYRFVPIQNGFVHGKLEKVADTDGGVPADAVP